MHDARLGRGWVRDQSVRQLPGLQRDKFQMFSLRSVSRGRVVGFCVERGRGLWWLVFFSHRDKGGLQLDCVWCFFCNQRSSVVGVGAGVVDSGSSCDVGINSCVGGGMESLSESSTVSISSVPVAFLSASYW